MTEACSPTWPEPMVEDNSGMATLTSNYPSDYVFPGGDTIVTYTATDDSNNRVVVAFVVTVTVGTCHFYLFVVDHVNKAKKSR